MATPKNNTTTLLILFLIIGLIGLFLWQVKSMLTAFGIGLVLAYLLNPPVEKLAARGLGRSWASVIPLVGFYVFLLVVVSIAIPLGVREGIDFAVSKSGFEENQIQSILAWLETTFGFSLSTSVVLGWVFSFGEHLLQGALVSMGALLTAGTAVGNVLALLLITPLVAFYMLRTWPNITEFVTKMIPPKKRKNTLAVLERMDAKLAGFVRGQVLICTIQGLFFGIGLQLIGLPFGFLLGMMIGVLSLIPVVGGLMGMALALLLSLLHFGLGGWVPYALILGLFIIGSVLESTVLTPKLMGDNVGLHPIWVIFALMAGGTLAGVVGMLLAVPVAAILSELLPLAVQVWKKSSYYR